jgi:hypothetical protein
VDNFNTILQTFSPISLTEMDRVELMDRKEMKYVFCANRLSEILQKASQYYQILEIESLRNFVYHTTYLDTCDLQFYNHHVCGKLNRFKVRYRIYESTGGSFLEIKCKSNKMRTIKWRIKNNMQKNKFDEQAENFLANHIGSDKCIKPILDNWFNRITLVGIGFNERVTLDFNLSFAEIDSDASNTEKIELPYLAIAEIKFDKSAVFSPFYRLLKELNIRPSSFSKYCIGNILLNLTQRTNIFKANLLTLEKIKDDYFLSASA